MPIPAEKNGPIPYSAAHGNIVSGDGVEQQQFFLTDLFANCCTRAVICSNVEKKCLTDIVVLRLSDLLSTLTIRWHMIPPDPYPFVPIVDRGPLRFPNGAHIAMIFTINMETWEKIRIGQKVPVFQGPMTIPSPLPADVFDSTNHTWREYGQRVGVWRLFEAFDVAGVPASCTFNALTAISRRRIVDAANERGWELVAHNWAQTDVLSDYSYDPVSEKDVINRTLDKFEEVVGRPAKVWLSSALRSTFSTPGFLVERGVIAFCDYLNDDQPYLISTEFGPLVATPYSNDVNDFAMFSRGNATSEMGLASLKTCFDELYREGAQTGRIMNVGLHPHVIGLPFRIGALRDFLDYVKSHEHVWFCSREELARWYLDNHKGHIPAQEC